MKLLKALIVEDSEDDALMLLRHLKRGGYEIEYQRVETAPDMEQALKSHDWQIVLSDYSMPRFDGLKALAVLKESGADIPFIMISGTIGEDIAVQAMLAGVQDYFVKGNLNRLIPAIEREIEESSNRTARRRIERQLEENKKRLQLALIAAGLGVWEWNLQNNVVYWSPECFEIFESEHREGSLDAFKEMVHPADLERVLKEMFEAAENQTALQNEFRIVKPNGEIIWVANYGITEYDSSGKPLKLIGTVKDITFRKKAENDLRESENRLRLATDVAKMFAWESDFETGKVKWADNAAKIIGCEPEDLPENVKDSMFFVKPEDRDDLLEFYEKIFDGGEQSYVKEFHGLNGRFWEADGVVVYDSEGKPSKVFGVTQDITQSKQVEEALRESEERLRRALEGANAGVWQVEFDTDIAYWSKEHREICGFTPDEKPSFEKWKSRIHPDDVEETFQHVQNLLKSSEQSELELEFRILHPEKGERWVQDRIRMRRDANGRPISFSGILLDITDRKRYVEALRESEENMRAIIKASTQFIFTAGEKGSSEEVFRWLSELSGSEINNVEGIFDIMHPADREGVRRVWSLAVKRKELFNRVIRFLTKSGEYRYLSLRAVPMFHPDGSFRQWVGTFNDITERKVAEDQLRKSEERFRSLINATAQIVWTADADGEITSVVSQYKNAFDLSKGTLTEQWILRLHPEERERVVSEFLEAVKTKQNYFSEFRILHNDQTYHYYVSRGTPVYESDGTIREWVGTLSDVTASKLSEENLRRSEEQLRQAQKLESVGRLAGGIAHDFNNMLTAINGYSDLALRRLGDNDPLRRNLEEIKKAGERSAALTQQLLAFSRRTILQMQVLDINQVVNDSIIMLQRLIGEDIQINSSLEPQIDHIKADAGQLSQMLLNLVVNSRDAMPQGGIISIETDNVFLDEEFVAQNPGSKTGDYVMLAVSDTGIGIDEETRQMIFEPFFTTKEIGKGTGLGLSTVYGIVNQLGGFIVVKSTVGVGTTFEIFLPSAEENKAAKVEAAATTAGIERGAETILLVEDEELVRNLTRQVLETCGYQVIEATNGHEALEQCDKKDQQIDLLLTDVVMPNMSGRELAEKVKEIHPSIKILFTSGYTEDAVVRHGISESEMNFIQKPFSFDELSKKVRKLLDAKKDQS